MKYKKEIIIILLPLILVGVLYTVSQLPDLPYWPQSFIRVVLLFVIPCVCSVVFLKSNFPPPSSFKQIKLSGLLPGFIIGIASFIIVLVAYAILNRFIDMQGVKASLETSAGVTAQNFISVGLFIIIINSFIEEYFFRGFLFLQLVKLGHRRYAYGYSAFFFALYHVLIIGGWFNPILMILALLALFIIGLVFNYIDEKSGTIANSWLAHACADSAIIIIGLRLFGIV